MGAKSGILGVTFLLLVDTTLSVRDVYDQFPSFWGSLWMRTIRGRLCVSNVGHIHDLLLAFMFDVPICVSRCIIPSRAIDFGFVRVIRGDRLMTTGR